MKNYWHKEYQKLYNVADKQIIYFEKNKKHIKTFSDFMLDVDKTITLINDFKKVQTGGKIGIIGPTSYMWMVIDHACIKGGFQSVAIPETLSQESLNEIIQELNIYFLLVDHSLADVLTFNNTIAIYFNVPDNFTGNSLRILQTTTPFVSDKNLIQEEFTIVFSSGTSERIKYIKRKFFQLKENKVPGMFKKIFDFLKYRGTIWMNLRNKKNKIIIFLPFSHPMQRDFVRIALSMRIDIVLSTSENCIKHIILEKPNVMVSVPPIYDLIAELIEARIQKFTEKEQKLFNLFLQLGLNKKSDSNVFKNFFSKRLFENVKKVYGTHADLFITGSAPIKRSTLETFYKVGVKIYEAYGQSELSTIIMNSPKYFKIGSVGKPAKNLVKIDNNSSEVLIKYHEEYDQINRDVLKVKDGYITTGDTGFIDKDGFLFITGRVDDVLVLKTGKKVHPYKLEKKLNQIQYVKNSLIHSPNGYDIHAFLFVTHNDEPELKKLVSDVNKGLLEHERISNISIIAKQPSVDNGLLTSTMKIKRKKAIMEFKNAQHIRI